MKEIIYLVLLCLSSLVNAQNEIETLFLDLPINSSRDVIYNRIEKVAVTSQTKNTIIGRGEKIKTYNGFLNENKKNQINKVSDTISIDLSTGRRNLGKNTYQDLLIISINYHFSNKQDAYKFFLKKKKEIDVITNEESHHYDNSFENIDKSVRYNGFSEKWFNLYDNHTDLDITFKKNTENNFTVALKYSRNEGQPKFTEQYMIETKKITEYNINKDSIYTIENLDNIPLPAECNPDLGKDDLIKCFDNSIRKYVFRKFDMNIASDNLTIGEHRMSSKFIIDKFGEIVNIMVRSENKKVSTHLKKVLNNIPKMKPGTYGGKNVNVSYLLNLTVKIAK